MFRCVLHHLQGELSIPYSKPSACTELLSVVNWLHRKIWNIQPRYRNTTKTGRGVFCRTLHSMDPSIIWSMVNIKGDTKKQERLKNPTKIEEIQEKKFIDRNWTITTCLL